MDVEAFSAKFLINIDKFWHYVIVSTSSKEVKVANIILALLAIYFCSKYYRHIISVILDRIIAENHKDNREIIQKVVSIVLGSMLLILVLQVANVPLDTFAFLGGALVLGFGLGIQNLISNLLSSFIIMVEKPFKVGDLITIDKYTGRIEEIGNRCITARSQSNAVVVIPSNLFIQNKLINWSKNNYLNYQIKLEVTKQYLKINSSDAIIQIIENGLLYNELSSSSVILSEINSLYCMYMINYTVKLDFDLENFRHKINNYLLQHLGTEIILQHVEQIQNI